MCKTEIKHLRVPFSNASLRERQGTDDSYGKFLWDNFMFPACCSGKYGVALVRSEAIVTGLDDV